MLYHVHQAREWLLFHLLHHSHYPRRWSRQCHRRSHRPGNNHAFVSSGLIFQSPPLCPYILDKLRVERQWHRHHCHCCHGYFLHHRLPHCKFFMTLVEPRNKSHSVCLLSFFSDSQPASCGKPWFCFLHQHITLQQVGFK